MKVSINKFVNKNVNIKLKIFIKLTFLLDADEFKIKLKFLKKSAVAVFKSLTGVCSNLEKLRIILYDIIKRCVIKLENTLFLKYCVNSIVSFFFSCFSLFFKKLNCFNLNFFKIRYAGAS